MEPTLTLMFYALTLVFAGSLAASLLASLRSVLRPDVERFSKVLAALDLAWFFALLSVISLVVFALTSAYADALYFLYLPDEIIFSRPFILFTFGALYLLPLVALGLEDAGASQTQYSSREVYLGGRHHGTF